jgi:8-oxo-dGTP pyrophosphatase MutT (NUDIX family)
VTGSGFVVGPRGVLLLRHLRLGVWLQPGGHVDEGETPWEGARREVSEETGLSAAFAASAHWRDGVPDPVHVSVHAVPDGHVHYDVRYLFTAGVAEPAPPPGESQDVRWYEWAAAIAIADPSLRAILHRLWADCGRGAPSGRHDVEPQPEGGGDLDGVEGHVDQRGRQA